MKRKVKITNVGKVREYTRANGDKVKSRTLAIQWSDEERYGLETYSLAVDVQGDLSEDLLDTYIKTGEELEMSFFMSVREWEGKLFTNCHGYLPAIFTQKNVNQGF